jgi:phosphate transport system substrate-binding protein
VNTRFTAQSIGLVLGLSLSLAFAQAPQKGQTDSSPADPGKPAVHHKKAATAKAEETPATPTIIWRGDHATARIFRDLIKQYETTKQGKVTLQPFSTVSGMDAVAAGTADVAGSARASMHDRAEEQGTNFYPVAWDALVPITSAKNPVGAISLKQLYELYMGRLTDWKDLDGAPAQINLYAVAGPLDGIEFSTRLLLFHDGDQAVSVPRLYVNTEKLEEAIAIDPHSIGMSTLSGVAANPGIKMLAVEGISASTASISDGTYPMYTALYLAARDDDKNHDAVAKFIHYTDTDSAKALLRKHSLVPYGDAPALIGGQDARVAFVDAHVHPELAVAAAPSAGGGTPVSAPNATAQALQRAAPTSQVAAEAKDRAARINADKVNASASPTTDSGAH